MRYKSTYQSNQALANAWASGSLSHHGDFFKANNMLCDHASIYSYGRHFCIARKGADCVLITNRGYSNTTSKHKIIVRRALRSCYSDSSIFCVPSLDNGSGPAEWVEGITESAINSYQRATRARSFRIGLTQDSILEFNYAARIAERFGVDLPTPAALPPGYLDFLVVESFKAKVDQPITEPFPTLHPCYTTPIHAIAA